MRRIVDVHHHFNPAGTDNEGKPWSVAAALDEMDRSGIAAALASLGPVNDVGDPDRPRRIRASNEWGARVRADHPRRFGLLAALPLPDVDLALTEVAYAFDVLDVDGIGLSSNDGDVWLSDDRYAPVLDELNRRRAAIFVHPAPTSRCRSLGQSYGLDIVSPPWLEFPVNTARAILGLLLKGAPRRWPDLRFVFAHGGGVMPLLLGRIAGFKGWASVGPQRLETLFPDGIHAEFAKFFFECGQACAPEGFALLSRVVPTSHILFGSDFSYFPIAHAVEEFDALGLDVDASRAILHDNACDMFPRLAARMKESTP